MAQNEIPGRQLRVTRGQLNFISDAVVSAAALLSSMDDANCKQKAEEYTILATDISILLASDSSPTFTINGDGYPYGAEESEG